LNARSGEKLAQIEMTATEVARKLLKIMQQFMAGTQVARYLGPQGETLWLPYTRESIVGEFDFTVEAGSTQPNNETFRRQKTIALMNTMVPFIQMGIVNPYELAKHILQEGFSVRVPEKFLMDPNQMGGMPPGMAPEGGGGNVPGADQGVDATQLPPQELLDQQQESQQEQTVNGVPDPLMAQLMGQVGVSPML
jgi:hypothetical protein